MAIDDIALTLVPGLGVKGVVHLLEVFGTAQAIFAASADELAGRAELRPDVARSKPAPDCFLEAMRREGCTPRETLIFEDSEIGLEAARRSGASYFRVKL